MNILVAHDGSAHADKALSMAVTMAEKFGGSLTILAVVPDMCLASEELTDQACDMVRQALDTETRATLSRTASGLSAKGVKADLDVRTGQPAEEIILAAEQARADLVVLGSHGRQGVKRFLLGSVSTKVAEHAPCNVLIVK